MCDNSSECSSSRRRIDEIKERRRRLHKETAERWILEQQFGERSAPKVPPEPRRLVDNGLVPPPPRHADNGSVPVPLEPIDTGPVPFDPQPSDNGSKKNLPTEDKTPQEKKLPEESINFQDRKQSFETTTSPVREDSTRAKPLTDRKSFLNAFQFFSRSETAQETRHAMKLELDQPHHKDLATNKSSPESPATPESEESSLNTNESSPPTIDDDVETPSCSSSGIIEDLCDEKCEDPAVTYRKRPSIPDILVLDPIVVVEKDTISSCRRRPSSILKKRDSSTISDEHTSSSSSSGVANVSFACEVDPGDEDETYRRRSRSYSGSSSGRKSPRRRNSAEAHFNPEDFQQHGILKHSCSSLSVDGGTTTGTDEFKSILKQPARRSSLGCNIHTAHQQTRFSDDYDFITSPRTQRSILKRKSSTSSSQPDVSTSSLRSTASSYSSRESLHEPDPKPILKKKSSSEEISDSDYNSTSITPPPPRPILKNKTTQDPTPVVIEQTPPIKPCLKKPCKSFDETTLSCNNAISPDSVSIMRKTSPHICSVKKCENDEETPPLFKRRDSEPLTSPTTMENNDIMTRRGSSGSFSFKRKHQIELGKLDFSGVYEPASQSSPETKKPQATAITQKIAALQISGESSWKKRVSKDIEVDGCSGDQSDKRAGILANRLSMLESSQESWRKRIGEKDAKEFTVQGKLERAGKKVISTESPPTSPTDSSPKKKTLKNVFRGIRGSKTDESIANRSSHVASTAASTGTGGPCVMIAYSTNREEDFASKNMFQRSKSMRYAKVSSSQQQKPNVTESVSSESKPHQQSSQHVVTVPVMKNDNETFTRFFESSKTVDPAVSVIVEEESFNSVIQPEDSRQLLGSKRQVILPRKKERGIRNPIKALAGRIGLQQQSYADVNPEIRERENIRRRIQMENSTSSTHAHLSIEALAGLASKEDFTSVKLRRAQQEISAQYPFPLLIRVKGKRFVQTRLAAPELTSVNSGDNFILITQTKVYHFIGEYSNRMERSKSLDIVAHILQKKEFGCNPHTKVVTLAQETLVTGHNSDSFFEVLGSTKDRKIRDDAELLGDEADESYETRVICRNKIWRVITDDELDEKLVPLRETWGTVPKHSLLNPTEVLIFDFGPEMYVWSGSKAPVDKKRLGYRLAQEIFEMEGIGKEFDDVKGSKPTKEGRRPSWCWLRKVNQHMEPILFIEKFFDWPEEIGRIRVGNNKQPVRESINMITAFQPCDAVSLHKAFHEDVPDVSLILEGFDVKRGRVHIDTQERRNYTITTTRLQTWAISEFSKSEVGEAQLGHFNSGSTYVIRWQYTIAFVGKDLKGNQSKHNANSVGGRDRCAYFFWHGKKSKITEQGASALMTVELDDQEEKQGTTVTSRGPQIRVEQNYEPPAFLCLFKGKMFIHDNQTDEMRHRLYVTLGTHEDEIHFQEVDCTVDSFRSNGCFLLLDVEQRVVFVWIGAAAAASHSKNFAVEGATSCVKNPNWTPGITKVVVVKQSQETDAFWSCFESHKIAWNINRGSVPVEMFRFTSINGKFEAIPVISPRRHSQVLETFPVLQEDLYGPSVSQPSIFLFLSPDNTVYLWQGWRRIIKREFIPEDEGVSQQPVDSIPLTTIWPKYRRCSVETGLTYASYKSSQHAYYVYAGLEPDHFTQMFPYWDVTVTREAQEYHTAEGKKLAEKVPLGDIMQELTAVRTYAVDELLEKPEGVDLSRMEDYISDIDFERLFSMPRTQFAQLQSWRKTELKKAVGLF